MADRCTLRTSYYISLPRQYTYVFALVSFLILILKNYFLEQWEQIKYALFLDFLTGTGYWDVLFVFVFIFNHCQEVLLDNWLIILHFLLHFRLPFYTMSRIILLAYLYVRCALFFLLEIEWFKLLCRYLADQVSFICHIVIILLIWFRVICSDS